MFVDICNLFFRYTLHLSELQVMIGRAMDNWKHAHNKGTSHMHVVDKFSISLQLERFVKVLNHVFLYMFQHDLIGSV